MAALLRTSSMLTRASCRLQPPLRFPGVQACSSSSARQFAPSLSLSACAVIRASSMRALSVRAAASSDWQQGQSGHRSSGEQRTRSNPDVEATLRGCGLFAVMGASAAGLAVVLSDQQADGKGVSRASMQLNPHEQQRSGLPTLPRAIWAILGINVAVFALHRVLPAPIAYKHLYTSNAHIQSGQYHTLLTAVFSHQGPLHLLANCWAIYLFAPNVHMVLGERDFVALYLSAGLVASVVSLATSRYVGPHRLRLAQMTQPSLGASGAVFGIVTASATLIPNTMYSILGLTPYMPASTFVPLLMCLDVAGVLYTWYTKRPSGLGHWAHLGGALFGYAFMYAYAQRFNPRAKIVMDMHAAERRRLANQ